MSSRKLLELSKKYQDEGHGDSALGCHIIIAGRYRESASTQEKHLCAQACKEAGTAYLHKSEYAKALKYLTMGARYCAENNFEKMLPALYNNIGCAYSSFNDFKISIFMFEKGLKISKKLKDKNNEKTLLTNLACHCSHQDIKGKAEHYNKELVRRFGREDKSTVFYYHLNQGWLYYNARKYREAAASLNSALDHAVSHNLAPGHTAVVYETLGNLYMDQPGKNDSAYHYLMKSYDFTLKHSLLSNHRNTLKTLAGYYNRLGNKKQEMFYKIKYWELSDSLLDENEFSKEKSEYFIYEIERNSEKIQRLNMEKEEKERQIRQSRIQLALAISGTLIFLILTTITIRQKRKLHKTYMELFKRDTIILRNEHEESLKHGTPDTRDRDTAAENKDTAKSPISEDQKGAILEKVRKITDSNDIFDCNFTLARLAELAGTNQHYMSQIINETYNKNFRTFINEYRIRRAQIMLMDVSRYGNYTIRAIAQEVGYKSHSSFITLFKKATGITPSMYQQLAAEQYGKTDDNDM